jgi:hypothetical protein
MKFHLGFGLLLSILLATIGVEAQFGGLIKKKIGEAVGGDKTKPESEPARPASALGCDVSGDAMDRLLKGMEAERAAREAALKELASAKSPAQYQACQAELAMSPEGQKIFETMASQPENASAADAQKAMATFASEMQALLEKQCGPEPSKTRNEFARKYEDSRNVGSQTANMTDCYAKIEEHAFSFCQLPESEQTKAENGGLKVPGTGTDVFWIFAEDEARAYKPRCERLVSAMAALGEQDEKKQAALESQ